MTEWIEFTAEQLAQRAKERPPGYAAEVMDRAHQWGHRWALSPEDFEALKYRYMGWGDLVEMFCQKTGIKRLVKMLERKTGKKCGCERRKAALNRQRLPQMLLRLLPIRRPPA